MQKLERLVRAQHTIAELQQQLEHTQQAAQQARLRLTAELETAKAEQTSEQAAVAQLQQDKQQLQLQLQELVANAEVAQQRLKAVESQLV